VEALARAGDDASLHQVDQRLRDDVRVDTEVAPLTEKAKHLVRHAPQADLQGRAIVNDPRHVSGNPFRRRPQRLVQVLDHRLIDRHDLVETVDRHLAGGARAGHVRIDLGDRSPSRHERGPRDIY
jgi:hypothetical protein